jgi:hypothetical protein
MVWVICCAIAVDGSTATASISAASTAFFMIIPLEVRSMTAPVARAPWLIAEQQSG